MKPPYRSALKYVAIASLLLFILGLFAPTFVIVPSTGNRSADAILIVLQPNLIYPESFSMVGALVSLFKSGEILLAMILTFFSTLFPLVKLSILLLLVSSPFADRVSPFAIRALVITGSWSMLEVFVLAVLVASLKGFPNGTQLYPQWGLHCFVLSVVLSIFVTTRIKLDRASYPLLGNST